MMAVRPDAEVSTRTGAPPVTGRRLSRCCAAPAARRPRPSAPPPSSGALIPRPRLPRPRGGPCGMDFPDLVRHLEQPPLARHPFPAPQQPSVVAQHRPAKAEHALHHFPAVLVPLLVRG